MCGNSGNGRRLRRCSLQKIIKYNKQISLINDNIVNTHRILNKLNKVLQPNDYLGGRISDNFGYNTWRTVGVLNLSDHFIVRYLERVENKFISDIELRKRFGYYNIAESDEMKIRMLEYDDFFLLMM